MTSSEPGSSLEEELLSLRLAVSNAVDLWALVEHELAFLLQAIIKDESGQIGLAIYYAPTNTETRIRVVDVAIKAAMGNRPHGGALVYCWQDLYRKMGKQRVHEIKSHIGIHLKYR